MSTPQQAKGPVSKTLDRIISLPTVLVPTFLLMAAYYAIGHHISETRPSVAGTIVDVLRNQGRHHVTTASVIFPSTNAYHAPCRVETWFRAKDEGITEGATIRVVPAILKDCGEPWFPDHLPPTSESIEIALGSVVISLGFSLCRRYARNRPKIASNVTIAEIEQLSNRDLADMGVDKDVIRNSAERETVVLKPPA